MMRLGRHCEVMALSRPSQGSMILSGDQMLATRGIAYKLILVITVCSAIIFTVTIGYFYHSSRVALERELEKNARNLVLASVNRVETELSSIGKVAEGVAHSLETGNYTEKSRN